MPGELTTPKIQHTGARTRHIREVRLAFVIVWLILSSLMLGILLAPFVVPPDVIARASPVCVWKARYGRECSLCGMTTAFILISEGRLREAAHANRGSLPLFAGCVINELIVLLRWRAPSRGAGRGSSRAETSALPPQGSALEVS